MPRKPLDGFEHGGRLLRVGANIVTGKSAPLGAPNQVARLRAPNFSPSKWVCASKCYYDYSKFSF